MAGGTGGTFDDSALQDGLIRPELIAGQVDLDVLAEPIPPVNTDARTADAHLSEDQVAGKQIMKHECGNAALPARRIVRTPRQIYRVAGVFAPAVPNSLFKGGDVQRRHVESLTATPDNPVQYQRRASARPVGRPAVRMARQLSSRRTPTAWLRLPGKPAA